MRSDPSLTYDDIRKMRPSYVSALSDRHYGLFGVLAGVRWREPTPLFPNRGLPPDVAKATQKELSENDLWGHTYFTLQELLETNWDATCVLADVVVFADQFIEWKESGVLPEDAEEAEYVSLRDGLHRIEAGFHRQVTEEEMTMLLLSNPVRKLLKKRKPRYGNGPQQRIGPYVVVADAPRSYRQVVPEFVQSLEDMRVLGEPDRVRVVIAFDN